MSKCSHLNRWGNRKYRMVTTGKKMRNSKELKSIKESPKCLIALVAYSAVAVISRGPLISFTPAHYQLISFARASWSKNVERKEYGKSNQRIRHRPDCFLVSPPE